MNFSIKKKIFCRKIFKKKISNFYKFRMGEFALVGKEWRYKNGHKIDSYKSIKYSR